MIAKRPLPARRFIDHNAFFEALARFDNKATAIIGHNRWRTRGSELSGVFAEDAARDGFEGVNLGGGEAPGQYIAKRIIPYI